jgi:streptomycin 6-kinase
MTPPAAFLTRFGLHDAVHADQSKIANVWKAMRGDVPVALKIYINGNTQDEWPGVAYIQRCAGVGAVEIYDYADGAIVMEWLDGPSLGDMARQGRDDDASVLLGTTARQLHRAAQGCDLPPLQGRMTTLLDLNLQAHWPPSTLDSMRAAQHLASQLINNQRDIKPLHGDLHHDNIRKGARGYLAFDAKGLIGDPAYDLANAFLNPIGAPTVTADTARMIRLANILAASVHIQAPRLLDWAIAHCALTLAWDNAALPDVNMLDLLMRARSLCDGTDTPIGKLNL